MQCTSSRRAGHLCRLDRGDSIDASDVIRFRGMSRYRYHLKNFGCQMNKLDSALLAAALEAGGFEPTDHVRDADVVLINTCSVRRHAEERAMSNLGHLQHLRATGSRPIVGVIGCMAQRLGRDLLEHEAVDLVAGPGQLARVPQLIQDVLQDRHKALAVSDSIRQGMPAEESRELDAFESTFDTPMTHLPGQAFVRAMRGCNRFCTYCIVPYVRGPEVSRPIETIVEQVRGLARAGVRQVTLLGQTINAYRDEHHGNVRGLADLLRAVSRVEGIRWIRFVTSHPCGFDEAILHAMAEIDEVCPYLHIPAQSGSDRILKAMNRGYTAAGYLEVLRRARAILPEIAIAGDFIVGFPNETEADFQATVDLVRKARYKNCFVFKYSPRPGTRADGKLADNVPAEIKKQRNQVLLDVQEEISRLDNQRFVGCTVEVLVEGPSKKPHLNQANGQPHPQLIGRTADDYIVVFNAPETLAGRFAHITIDKAEALTLFGHFIGEVER